MKNFIYYLLCLSTLWGLTAVSALGQNCPVNTNIASSSNPNGTSVTWDAVSGAMQYELRYRQVGTSALSYVTSTSNNFTFTSLMSNVCYEYAVRTICDTANVGPWSPGQSFCVAGSSGFCAQPSNTTSITTTNTAALSWPAVTNAQSYEIRYREVGTYPLTYATTATNSLSLTGLVPNTCYEFAIRTGCDTSNFSPWSLPYLNPNQQFCTTIPTQPCTTPTNVVATPNTNGAVISWNTMSSAMSYEVRYRKVGTSTLTYVTTTTNSLALSNLLENVCYEFSIRSQCDSNYFSPWMVPAQSFCVPGSSGFCAAPSNVVATPSFNSSVLNWTAVNGAQSYEIRYREVGTYPLTYATTATNSLSLIGLVPNTCYEFAIRTGCDTSNFSPWSLPYLNPNQQFCTTIPTQPCTTPTNVVATPTTNGAVISWNTMSSAMSYEVRYRKVGTSTLTYVTTTTNSLALSNLLENVCYEFSIRSQCDSNYFSPWMVPAQSFCVPGSSGFCAAPSNVVATPSFNSSVLNWTAVNGAQSYEIRYREVGTYPLTYVTTATNSLSLTGLAPNTCYEFAIRTGCDTSNFSPWSLPYLNPNQRFCTDTLNVPCRMPTNLQATNLTNNSASFSWTGNSTAGFGYQLRYRAVGSTSYSSISTNNTSATLGNLIPSSCYYASVRTRCTFTGSSIWSTEVLFCTDTVTNTPCPSPTNIRVDSTGTNFGVVTWTGSSNAVFGYQVRYQSFNDTTVSYINTNANTLSAVLGNLQDATCYTYAVRARCDSNNYSPWVTLNNGFFCTDTILCATPTNPQADSVTTNLAFLSWMGSNTSNYGYEVRYARIGSSFTTFVRYTTNTLLPNLQAGECYTFQVRAICDTFANNYSTWSDSAIFCMDTIVAPPCNTPTNVGVDSVGLSFARINWMGMAVTQGYEIRYREIGTTALSYIYASRSVNSIIEYNLMPGTCYEYSIRTICDSVTGNYSPWTVPALTFCTDSLPCATPSTPQLSQTTSNLAVIFWNGNGTQGYDVRYRGVNNTAYSNLYTPNNADTIYNLPADSCFFVSVRAYCPNGGVSGWSSDLYFCTDTTSTPPCVTPNNIVMDTVGNNFAFFTWDSVLSANYYLIRFRQANSSMSYTYDSTFFNNYGNYNLAPNTCYELEVQTYCNNGVSNWSSIQSFCTDSISFNCPRPTNTFVITNPNTANINWSPITGAVGYEVRFRLLGSTMPYTTLYSSDTTAFTQTVQPSTCYEYNVRTKCDTFLSPTGNYTYSFWSIKDTFCTPPPRMITPDGSSVTSDLQSTTGTDNAPIRYTVFPNPTTGQVNIKFNRALTTDYTVRVYNVLGAEVTPSVIKRQEQTCTLDLSRLTNGLYMIEVSTAQQRWTERVQVYK